MSYVSGSKYSWGYGPRLLPDAASGLQAAQQRNPGTVQSNNSPPGASSSQDHALAGAGSVHPPEVPIMSPRSGAHVISPVSRSRLPVSSGSSQSDPRMAAAWSQVIPRGSGDEKPSFGSPQMVPNDVFMKAMALAQDQSVPSRTPNMGPAVPFLFPGSHPGAPTQSFSQDEQQLPAVPGPPVYIIQSRNGFMRLSRQSSRAKYSPEYLEDLTDGGDVFAFLGASDPRLGLKV